MLKVNTVTHGWYEVEIVRHIIELKGIKNEYDKRKSFGAVGRYVAN